MARYDSKRMEEEIVSKSEKKRQMEALQKLGAALVALPPAQLATVEVPEELLAAIREAQRITSHEGRRRQLQFIGKLMRKVDPAPLQAGLDRLTGRSAAARVEQRRLEQWRERLIADDGALTAFAEAHPGADLQAIRTLIRNARREIEGAKPPRAQRELFRILREMNA